MGSIIPLDSTRFASGAPIRRFVPATAPISNLATDKRGGGQESCGPPAIVFSLRGDCRDGLKLRC